MVFNKDPNNSTLIQKVFRLVSRLSCSSSPIEQHSSNVVVRHTLLLAFFIARVPQEPASENRKNEKRESSFTKPLSKFIANETAKFTILQLGEEQWTFKNVTSYATSSPMYYEISIDPEEYKME